jgi:hypothetical protein
VSCRGAAPLLKIAAMSAGASFGGSIGACITHRVTGADVIGRALAEIVAGRAAGAGP